MEEVVKELVEEAVEEAVEEMVEKNSKLMELFCCLLSA